MKAEPSQHFALPKLGNGQSATVEILDHPFSFQGNIQQGRTDRATHMRSPLTPVHAGTRKATPLLSSCLDVNANSRKRFRSVRGELVHVVAR
jgi:hypothetical protein